MHDPHTPSNADDATTDAGPAAGPDGAGLDVDPTQPGPPRGYIGFLQRHIWKIGIAFGLLLITGLRPFLIERPEPPPVYAELPEFSLLDHEGRTFSNEEMRGTVWVVGFVFTRCVTLCPPVSNAMARLQEHLDRSRVLPEVKLLTVTVDPQYDTPEVLTAYAEKIGADLDSWELATGDVASITSFVVDGFKLAVGERKETAPGIFDIAHSSKLALVDRNGGVRGVYSTDDAGLEELYHRTLAVLRIPETPAAP